MKPAKNRGRSGDSGFCSVKTKLFVFCSEYDPSGRNKNDTIQTTKPNASLHGFGLSNIKLILNKYHADFVMDYEDGWFQFTGEIEAQVRK